MPICHILPGDSEGDTAQIIVNQAAIPLLLAALEEARIKGLGFAQMTQKDGVSYTLAVEVVPHAREHKAWRDVPYAYLEGKAVRYDSRKRAYEARLLARDLFRAKRKNGHDTRGAALAMGVSIGFVSDILNCKGVNVPRHLDKVAAYCGTDVGKYLLQS